MDKYDQIDEPDDDDGEIEQIPAVSQIGASVHHEAVSEDLHHALSREDYQENVFDLLLQSGK